MLTTFIDQPLPDATFDSEDLTTSDGNNSKDLFPSSSANNKHTKSFSCSLVHSWLIHYTSLLHSSLDIILGGKHPIYSHILDFDRKIRDFNVPVNWRMLPEDNSSRPHRDIHMYRWLVLSSKEIS